MISIMIKMQKSSIISYFWIAVSGKHIIRLSRDSNRSNRSGCEVISKDNLKWHHFIKCYALLKCHKTIFFIIEIACLFPMYKFKYLENVSVISVQWSILIGPYEPLCVWTDPESMATEMLFDSQPSGTGEKAICCFFPKWKRKKSARVRNLSHDANVKTTVCPIR